MVVLLLAACAGPGAAPTQPPAATPASDANLPNPASVYCEQQGYRLEIRTAADGNQSGVCVFPDGAECDEWAFYRGECGPAGVTPWPSKTANEASVTPAAATALPTLEGGYAGWRSYTQSDYGFEFLYPPDWVVVPDDNPVSTLYGHALFVQPEGERAQVQLRVVFRRVGEDLLLWPTGVGDGEFFERDSIIFMDGELRRTVLMCQGHDMAVWYRNMEGAVIQRSDLEFSFILARSGSCADGEGLSPADQVIANMIVASFKQAGRAGAVR
jgi:putative hemolysin